MTREIPSVDRVAGRVKSAAGRSQFTPGARILARIHDHPLMTPGLCVCVCVCVCVCMHVAVAGWVRGNNE